MTHLVEGYPIEQKIGIVTLGTGVTFDDLIHPFRRESVHIGIYQFRSAGFLYDVTDTFGCISAIFFISIRIAIEICFEFMKFEVHDQIRHTDIAFDSSFFGTDSIPYRSTVIVFQTESYQR